MAPDAGDRDGLRTLIGEVRAAREALHDLVERLRRERGLWNRDVADLAQRPRLTRAQRQNLRRYLGRGLGHGPRG